jgi:peptide/nickel transport system substrate-binding protein
MLLVMVVGLACGSSTPSTGPGNVTAPSGEQPAARSGPPKRLVAAVRSTPGSVSADLNQASVPGNDALQFLVSSALSALNDEGVRLPQLAEAVPTVENGLWKLLPDGRMETTWRIKEGARWHDGRPLVAADYAFASRVRADREVPIVRNRALLLIDSIETPDDRTLVVHWKQPFIDADTLFSDAPLPAHLLEPVYRDAKETLATQPYWSEAFVGTGPYRVREFSAGSHVVLEAFDGYLLGRPRIAEVEVRFIPDGATLIANVLSDVVQLSIGARNLSYEEASQAREQWREGAVVANQRSTVFLYPQFLNPNPAIIGNVVFRRALLHAMDREEMGRTFQGGLSGVPHAYVSQDVAEYQEIKDAATVYEYDPRRTMQLVESLGFSRDGQGMYRDGAGQRPTVEVRTTTASENQKLMLSIVDYWQRAGIGAEPHTIPGARAQDAEYRANYPGFEMVRAGDGKGVFSQFHSAQARLPENNYRGGPAGDDNRLRYMNPVLDNLMDRYAVTIPWAERMAVARDIIRLETDQVVAVGVIYSADANLVSNHLQNISQRVWNAHVWEMR